MTDEQIKIGNAILQYISEKKGYCSNADLSEYLSDGNFDRFDVMFVKNRIQEQDLLNEREVMTTLNTKGSMAAKMGYSAYLNYLEKKVKEKEAKDHRDAVMSKWQIVIFWPMFVFATAGTFFGIVSFIWQLLKWLG